MAKLRRSVLLLLPYLAHAATINMAVPAPSNHPAVSHPGNAASGSDEGIQDDAEAEAGHVDVVFNNSTALGDADNVTHITLHQGNGNSTVLLFNPDDRSFQTCLPRVDASGAQNGSQSVGSLYERYARMDTESARRALLGDYERSYYLLTDTRDMLMDLDRQNTQVRAIWDGSELPPRLAWLVENVVGISARPARLDEAAGLLVAASLHWTWEAYMVQLVAHWPGWQGAMADALLRILVVMNNIMTLLRLRFYAQVGLVLLFAILDLFAADWRRLCAYLRGRAPLQLLPGQGSVARASMMALDAMELSMERLAQFGIAEPEGELQRPPQVDLSAQANSTYPTLPPHNRAMILGLGPSYVATEREVDRLLREAAEQGGLRCPARPHRGAQFPAGSSATSYVMADSVPAVPTSSSGTAS